MMAKTFGVLTPDQIIARMIPVSESWSPLWRKTGHWICEAIIEGCACWVMHAAQRLPRRAAVSSDAAPPWLYPSTPTPTCNG